MLLSIIGLSTFSLQGWNIFHVSLITRILFVLPTTNMVVQTKKAKNNQAVTVEEYMGRRKQDRNPKNVRKRRRTKGQKE